MPKSKEEWRRKRAAIYRMARMITSPQHLALILQDVEESKRGAVYNMLLPMLRPEVREKLLTE